MVRLSKYNFNRKKVTVMGLGLFGGGVGVTRYLVEKGAKVTVTDLRSEKELMPSLQKLDGLDVAFHLGGHSDDDFSGVNYVFASPAVHPDSPYLQVARQHRVPVATEATLFLSRCPSPVIGVTGTLGKSTTVAMLDSIFRKSSLRFFVGGNIGISLLDSLDEMNASTPVILELSSFQLLYLHKLKISPHIAVITSLYPNHLEYHKTMKAYIRAKSAILKYQTWEDYAVLGDMDALVYHYCESGKGRKYYLRMGQLLYFEDGLYKEGDTLIFRYEGQPRFRFPVTELGVFGNHNIHNAMAAAAAAYLAGLDEDYIYQGLRDFKGIPHRLEVFLTYDNKTYINDSKSTTPDSTIAAVASMSGPYILIIGGHDKGLSFEKLYKVLDDRLQLLIIMGEAGERIESGIETVRPDIPSKRVQNLQDAVKAAVKIARNGDTVLFSPACSSYDAFVNYEERGETFKRLIHDSVRK